MAAVFVGLDVSLRTACDLAWWIADGSVVWEGKAETNPCP